MENYGHIFRLGGDRKFAAKGRNVFFVDNYMAHCDAEGLRTIRLVFLPKNTMAVLQPTDTGVIQNVKTLYRRHIVEQMLLCMDSEKTYAVDLLSAIHILATAWGSIKPDTIGNCFRRCRFGEPAASGDADQANDEAVQTSPDNDDNCVSERGSSVLPNCVTFESYVNVDAGVEICGVVTDAEILQATCPQQSASGDPSTPSGKD